MQETKPHFKSTHQRVTSKIIWILKHLFLGLKVEKISSDFLVILCNLQSFSGSK